MTPVAIPKVTTLRSLIGLGALCCAGAAVGLGVMAGAGGTAHPAAQIQAAAPVSALPSLALSLTSAQAALPATQYNEVAATLQRKETLSGLMDRLGADRGEANAALYALYGGDLIDPRRVLPGLEVRAIFDATQASAGSAGRLVGLMVNPDTDRGLTVSRKPDGSYVARVTHTTLTPTLRTVKSSVTTSLYEAALAEGATDQQVVDFASIFAYDVDFQREMREGDTFEIVYEAMVDERGRTVRTGEIVYAELNGHFTDRAFYRFTPPDDEITDYFDANGESARKFLMKMPVNGARLSSSFGMRKHPISGYTKLHKGTDFAAPSGTPIMATGNGTIIFIGWNGGYGNYIKIRHANGYETAYAHMSKFARGLKVGSKVRQGDTIGYVGTTGASTGPHCHYEVYYNGKPIDPMSLKLPTGRKLEGDILVEFNAERARIDALRGVAPEEEQQALATGGGTISPSR